MEVHKYPSIFYQSRDKGVFWNGAYWDGLRLLRTRQMFVSVSNVEDLVEKYPLVLMLLQERLAENRRGMPRRLAVTVPTSLIENSGILTRLKEGVEKVGFSVEVYPQAVYAVINHLDNLDLKKGVLVIDGGFNTVNVVVCSETSGVLDVVFGKTYYDELGFRKMIEDFRELVLRKVYDFPSNLVFAKEAFLKGYYVHGTEKISLEKEKEMAVSSYITNLLNTLYNELKTYRMDYEQILVVGGLAHYVEIKGGLPVVYGDEFSNAVGIYRYTGMPVVDFGFGDVKIVM